jgi:hypothetical protein
MNIQTTRRAKLLTPQPALLKLQNQPLDLRPAPPMKPCTHSVYIHASTSTKIKSQRKNAVARRDTFNRLPEFKAA